MNATEDYRSRRPLGIPTFEDKLALYSGLAGTHLVPARETNNTILRILRTRICALGEQSYLLERLVVLMAGDKYADI